MDINKDSLVDLNEFLETFRLCEQERGNSYKSEVLAVHFDLPNDTAIITATASKNDVNNDNDDNDNNTDNKNTIINRNAIDADATPTTPANNAGSAEH